MVEIPNRRLVSYTACVNHFLEHDRNCRGCRQIDAINKCDSNAKGCNKNKSRLNEEKEKTGIRFNEPATKLANPAHDSSSIATHRAPATAAAVLYTHIRVTSRLLRRHLNHHRTYFYTVVKKIHSPTKKSENGTQKKNTIRDRTTDPQVARTTTPLYLLHT